MAKSRDRQTSSSVTRGRRRSTGRQEEFGTLRWKVPGSPELHAFHEAWGRSGLGVPRKVGSPEGESRAESGRDRGARSAVQGTSRGRERPTSLVLSPAEASRGVVKRRSLRSRSTARKTREARVLVVNVLGSRRRSDASSVARRGEPQGRPVARASPREVVTPLVRVAGDSKAKRCAQVAQIQSDDARRAFRAVGLRKLHTAPKGLDTTEGTSGVVRPPHGGSLRWERAATLAQRVKQTTRSFARAERGVGRVLLSGWSRQGSA
jgi:hypothetical protein